MTKKERKQLGQLRVKEAREKALTRFKEAKPKLVSLAVRALTEAKAKIDGGKLKEAGLDEAKLRLGKLGERMKNLAAALAAPKADAKSIASDIKTDLDELMQAAGITAEDVERGYEDEAKTGYAEPRHREEEEGEDEAATELGDKTVRKMGYEDERMRSDESEDEDEGEDELESEDEGEDELEGYEDGEEEEEDEEEGEGYEDGEEEGDINIRHDAQDGDAQDGDDSDLGMDGDGDEEPVDGDDMGDEDQDAGEDEGEEDEAGAQKMQFKCAKCGEGNVVLPPKGMKLVASEAARAASEAVRGLKGLAARLRESIKAKEGRMKTQNAKVREAATAAEKLAKENKQLREDNRRLRASNIAERRMREAKRMLAESNVPAGILSATDLVQFEPHQWAAQIKIARRTVRMQESEKYGDGNRPGDRQLTEAQQKDLAEKAIAAYQTEYKR